MKLVLITSLLLFFIPSASSLIPADNIADNKSYIAEPNTNTSFDPENYEVFEPEETTVPIPILTSQSTSSSGSGGSGSGGGGGGVVSTENYSNILKYEQHESTLIAGQPMSFKFNLPIYEILLTGKENEYDVSVRVELLKDKPNKATSKPDGNVIQYFNIITSTKKLKEIVIRFKTEHPDVWLVRWNGEKWIGIETQLRNNFINNKDTNINYYDAYTNQFSNFAIIKHITTFSAPPTQSPTTSTTTTSISNSATPIPIHQSSSVGIIGAICAMLIIKTKYYKNK